VPAGAVQLQLPSSSTRAGSHSGWSLALVVTSTRPSVATPVPVIVIGCSGVKLKVAAIPGGGGTAVNELSAPMVVLGVVSVCWA
jgi:hypothetical protein